MNAVTTRHAGAVSPTTLEPVEPRMSRALAVDVARLVDPDPAAQALRSFSPRSITPAQRQEAEWVAERYRKMLDAPVTRAQLVAWLGAVNAACRNPQNEADLRVRINAIGQDCAHLPGACFTVESRRALYAETRFFPSAGDVLAVVEPIAKGWRAKLAALERIANPGGGCSPALAHEPQQEQRTPEVVAHVAAQLQAFKADVAARRNDAPAGSEARPVTPRHLTPAQLAATLRQQIASGKDTFGVAAMRLRALEQRHGAGTAGGTR
jgi:hypothetical protein